MMGVIGDQKKTVADALATGELVRHNSTIAGAEAASDRMCIATNASMMVPLSAQDVCFNGGGFMSQGCDGGQITSPWSYMKKGGMFGGKGAVSGGQYQGSGPFGKGMCA